MYITNIDTLSALIDRLISENIKLYFFKKDKLTKSIKHQELVIKEIKMRLNSFLTSTIGSKEYEYVSEKRTYKPDDIVETIEELIYNDLPTGEGDRANLEESLSDKANIDQHIIDKYNGYVFKLDSINDLIRKINYIVENIDSKEVYLIRENAYNYVKDIYSIEKIVLEYNQLYEIIV